MCSVQFLVDLLQWWFGPGRGGHLGLWAPVEGGGLEDDLEGLAAGAFIQLDHLHVPDTAQVQVHHTCSTHRGLGYCGLHQDTVLLVDILKTNMLL